MTWWLKHVDVLLNITLNECTLDINNLALEFFCCNNREQQRDIYYGARASNRCKHQIFISHYYSDGNLQLLNGLCSVLVYRLHSTCA
jgi:hypothetical protein